MSEFMGFPKIARLSRECIITEKIDGTNAQVVIEEFEGHPADGAVWQQDGLAIYAGSRTRFITPEQDNHGFARWVQEHAEELVTLGPGRHFGEWWGCGIQRGYGLKEKRFSLFNTTRWCLDRPACCDLVPVLYQGPFTTDAVEIALVALRVGGSMAVPGFMRPEGVVVFHLAGNVGFKKTLEKDDEPKSTQAGGRR